MVMFESDKPGSTRLELRFLPIIRTSTRPPFLLDDPALGGNVLNRLHLIFAR
ncbi:MAG: hypothetical protein KKG33_03025 [candidate division Zixibacteria bacterium]|nr:hypothetical protein [candidate division Zixibacteria bacterium]